MAEEGGIWARLGEVLRHTLAVFTSPETPLYVKLVLAAGVLYALSPYDLIPEWIPVLGVMDDLALVALLIAWANRFTLPRE
ncbi:YkvA family protein [Desulfogranum mediterraneum]|uniref:YkvA family protein n=1 Tax=Desulfogranum mediterraneum TaxID=160661 RepID=UPI00040D9E7D|nr:DUF1232 domain-containing protein [Desulfogranum mediterraneum]